MTLALAAAAAAAMLAVPAAARDRAWTSPEELARLGAEAHAACSVPGSPPPTGVMLIHDAVWLAGLVYTSETPCAARPALAMRIARAVAASRTSAAGPGHGLLARFYEQGVGVAANPIAARRHRELEWLLGTPGVQPPFATRAEEEAFLTRPESIAYLEPFAAVEDMWSAHRMLAQALFVRGRRADAARIEALLSSGYNSDYHAQLMRVRSALRHGDAAARARAATQLRALSISTGGGTEARALLMPIVQRQIRSRLPEERWEAIESLAVFALTAEAVPLAALQQAVRTANGGRSPPTLQGPAVEAIRRRLRLPTIDDDYPAAAIRGEVQGRIALRGLIDPRGKLIYTEPLSSGQPPILLNATRNMYARRRIATVDLGALRTAPYMWIELPGVRFVLPERE